MIIKGFKLFSFLKVLSLFLFLSSKAYSLSLSHNNKLSSITLLPVFGLDNSNYVELRITNTLPKTKAIRIRFRGEEPADIISFNIYLGPNKTWSSKLININNKIEFQSSGSVCTLGVQSLDSTTQSGMIELIEMGESSKNIDNCSSFTQLNQDLVLSAPQGGLMVSAHLTEQVSKSIFKVYSVGFNQWSQNPLHFPPESSQPELSDVNPKETLWINNSKVEKLNWNLAPPQTPFLALLYNQMAFTEYETNPDHVTNSSLLIFNPFQNCLNLKIIQYSYDPKKVNILESQSTCSRVGFISINSSSTIKPSIGNLTVSDPSGRLNLLGDNVILRSDEGIILIGSPIRVFSQSQSLIGNKKFFTSSEAKYKK